MQHTLSTAVSALPGFFHQINESCDWLLLNFNCSASWQRQTRASQVYLKFTFRNIQRFRSRQRPVGSTRQLCFRSRQMFCLIIMQARGWVRCHHPYAVYPGAAALNNYLIFTWMILIRFMVRFLEWEIGQCLWCIGRLFVGDDEEKSFSNVLSVCIEWFEFGCVCVCEEEGHSRAWLILHFWVKCCYQYMKQERFKKKCPKSHWCTEM